MTTTDEGKPPKGQEKGRGRRAWLPKEVPLKGWKDILIRTWQNLLRHNTGLIAAGIAFYALLAIFPAIAATMAIWGLVADPGTIVNQMEGFAGLLPPQAANLLLEEARKASAQEGQSFFTALFAILFGIWSASKGANAVIDGLNVAYHEHEKRGFVRRLGLRVVFTFFGILGVVGAAGLVILLPIILEKMYLPVKVELWIGFGKWMLMGASAMLAFALLYRFAPSRQFARWSWLSPGAILGVLVWVAGSALFSLYVSKFANYNEMYGTIGGVVVLLMWLYLTSFVVLLGAELNAELERQTKRDTTKAPVEPMGERGAYVADTVGRATG
ncbi:MAG: YihY/virulence factor BrkB family protein [Parvularcula sp.]|jgi:membrane protein|nr:YihY/virulence factor BrkB family protein [Parvularcula sp.]